MQAYLVLALVFFAGIAVFVFQNPTMVTVNFINWTSPKVSIAVVALMAACAGAMLVFLVDSFRYFKVAKATRELSQANRKLESELKSLKGEKSTRKDRKGSEKGKTATPDSSPAENVSQPSPDIQPDAENKPE